MCRVQLYSKWRKWNVVESMKQCIEILTDISHEELVCMGNNAKQLAKTLLPENMVEKACSVI